MTGTGARPTGLGFAHGDGRWLTVTWRGVELLRYVYAPWDAQVESPRPYFHPVRTLTGDLVSLYRPHDHVWHKGLAWGLSNVGLAAPAEQTGADKDGADKDGTGHDGCHNFWGGPTYLRGYGYRQLANNGTMRHDRFDRLGIHDDAFRADEWLTWLGQDGVVLFAEQRRFAVTVLPASAAWRLAFSTTLHNLGRHTVTIGSPTTQGRDNAGYSGLFWRGPRSFSGGRVLMPDAEGGDEMMGRTGEWLAFVGRHDGDGRASTLLFRDDPGNIGYPTQWFVRSGVYACVCTAPFFSKEYPFEPDDRLTLRYDVVIADGQLDRDAAARLAEGATAVELGGRS